MPRDKEVRYINQLDAAKRVFPVDIPLLKSYNSFYGINSLFSILLLYTAETQAFRIEQINRRIKEKAANAAVCLKLKEKRELDKQGKPSMLHSIVLYYFSNFNF